MRDPNTGPIGEELVARFLVKRGYRVLDRNYRRPWGELDVVAEKKGIIHFIEVKTVTHEMLGGNITKDISAQYEVTHENKWNQLSDYVRRAEPKDYYRPEDKVGVAKVKRLRRIIETYLHAKHVSSETEWRFDIAGVYIDSVTKKAKIDYIENMIL